MRHVFIDESSQTAHQFMVLGALVLPGALVTKAESELTQLLDHHGMRAELKWTKVSRTKLPAYQAMVDFYFRNLVPQGAQFHALVVNCYDLDHHTYNQGDPDLGFNKFIYNLLIYRVGKRFGDVERIVVDLDSRNSTRDLIELQTVLNRKMAQQSQEATRAPFARLAFRDSKSTRLLQLADLLTGSIAWHKNDHDAAPNSSAAKSALANHAAGHLHLRRLGGSSPIREERLSVWNFALQPRRRGRPAV